MRMRKYTVCIGVLIKQGFDTVTLNRAVLLPECPLRELRLYSQIPTGKC